MERYTLAMERIRQIPSDVGIDMRYHDFFCRVAQTIIKCDEIRTMRIEGNYLGRSIEELKELEDAVYMDMLPKSYDNSYLKPSCAVSKLGECGRALSAVYKEVYALPRLIAMADDEKVTRILEMMLGVYSLYTSGDEVPSKSIEDVMYWYAFDYLDDTVEDRLRQVMDPSESFVRDIIMNSDLNDLRYLYDFGDYISDIEIETASYMNALDEDTIEKMASAFVDGFENGYIAGRKDMSRKSTVQIRYNYGFERVVRSAIDMFEDRGLSSVCTVRPIILSDRSPLRSVGCGSCGASRQCEYDHRYDSAIFYDKAYTDRRMTLLKMSYDKLSDMAHIYAGPAVMEVFGEPRFEPVIDEMAYSYTDKQKQLMSKVNSEAVRMQNEYIPGDEISFTIIAWPLPTIGDNYKEIFKEIIKINTLDSAVYQDMQQHIIDILDTCESVHITGVGDNHTDLTVMLRHLDDPSSETLFENCVSDVNIPLGEVFTSPVLEGTTGVLEVSGVYIDGYQLKKLRMEFTDGMVTACSCSNYEDVSEGRKLIDDLILKNHKSLPMGEFAIGTNTLAYAVARKYGILGQLPILIVEKMGPHFAVGDTCYSFEEDVMTYNPDGKAIVARDNAISALRDSEPEQAYFGCHTDITIPYDEIDAITGIRADKSEVDIIRGGRFVPDGLDILNESLS